MWPEVEVRAAAGFLTRLFFSVQPKLASAQRSLNQSARHRDYSSTPKGSTRHSRHNHLSRSIDPGSGLKNSFLALRVRWGLLRTVKKPDKSLRNVLRCFIGPFGQRLLLRLPRFDLKIFEWCLVARWFHLLVDP